LVRFAPLADGQGVVAEGHIEPGGTFTADTVLPKHDESYMPREVASFSANREL
jgi:cytochrome c-type biogenesis protein CcmE